MQLKISARVITRLIGRLGSHPYLRRGTVKSLITVEKKLFLKLVLLSFKFLYSLSKRRRVKRKWPNNNEV